MRYGFAPDLDRQPSELKGLYGLLAAVLPEWFSSPKSAERKLSRAASEAVPPLVIQPTFAVSVRLPGAGYDAHLLVEGDTYPEAQELLLSGLPEGTVVPKKLRKKARRIGDE